jgi:acetyl-CoA carboxylase carboxyl transferase subunit alpha
MEGTHKAQQELEQIERQVALIEATAGPNDETQRQLAQLQERVHILRQEMKELQTAWQKTELARHPQRPQMLDYVERLFTDWSEIHGDRSFGDDAAIICGMARFHGEEVLVVGTQKGRDMKQRVYRNFGTPHPEGYRKALRVMQVAEKFRRPIFTLVDTDGAYPGIHAEERGQAEAIAHNLREMARLEVPIIATVIGVGGSGGALAIAVADRVLMMENSIYSVISPEGCAAIMWRDSTKKELAAEAMRITATDLSELGCIDDIVPEPEGGAHRDHEGSGAPARCQSAEALHGIEETLNLGIDRIPLQEVPQHCPVLQDGVLSVQSCLSFRFSFPNRFLWLSDGRFGMPSERRRRIMNCLLRANWGTSGRSTLPANQRKV